MKINQISVIAEKQAELQEKIETVLAHYKAQAQALSKVALKLNM